MSGDDDKIINLIGRLSGASFGSRDQNRCLNEEALAQFLSGELAAEERESIEVHLTECAYCAEELVAGYKTAESVETTRVPQHLVKQVMALVRDRAVFFDVAVRFVKDSIEVIHTSGLLVPMLSPIVRGEVTPGVPNGLQVEQKIGRFKVAVEIDLNGAGTCQVTANLSEETGAPAENIRLTLQSNGREQASFLTRAGVVVFDRIAPGEYSIAVFESDKIVGKIRLNLILER